MTDTERIGERIELAIRETGITAQEIAERMEVSQSYVSHWKTGRRTPSPEQIRDLSSILNVSADWLIRGTESKQTSSLPAMEWSFRRAPEDGGRDFGNSNVFATPPDIGTIVRESGQNTTDAALPGLPGPVHLRYSIVELVKGSPEYRHFSESARLPELIEHVNRAAATNSKLGSRLQSGLARLEEQDRLVLLRIDDYGTTGLYGEDSSSDEKQSNPFAALVKNNLDSSKLTTTAGGSFGLGKAVLWRCSDLSTVLFATRIADEHGNSRGRYRVSGKTELTWHKHSDEAFAGPGWLSVAGTDADSVWVDEGELLEDLQMDRARHPEGMDTRYASGTSILVLGFRDPQEADFDASATVEAIREAVARNFWPLLVQGRLQATVEHLIGSELKDSRTVDPADYVPDLVETLQRHYADEVTDTLSEPGDVARFVVPLTVTRTRREAKGIDHYDEDLDSACQLLLRLAEPDTADRDLEHVALVRGSGMVVKYLSRKNIVVGGRPFHAILLAGTAAGSDASHHAAEQLLRMSEPPAHNEWEYNDDLRSKYHPGPKSRLSELISGITDTIREVISPVDDGEDEGPRDLQRLLQISTIISPPPPPATIRNQEAHLENGKWHVSGEVYVNDSSKSWRILPRLWLDVESGRRLRLGWESMESNGQPLGESGALDVAKRTRRVPFHGVSQAEAEGVPASRCRLVLDLHSESKEES